MSYSIALDLDLDPRTDAEIAADRIEPGIHAAVVGPPLPLPPTTRARYSTWEEEFKANSTSAERKAWDKENRPDSMTPEQAEWKAIIKGQWADPAYRAKQSVAVKEWWADLRADPVAFEVYQAKQSATIKAGLAKPGVQTKRSAALKATLAKPAVKAKQSAATKTWWTDPGYRAKQVVFWTPERRAEQGERNRSPENRAKLLAANRGRTVSPETRAKLSAASKKSRKDPAYRAKNSAASKVRWTDPAYKAKQKASWTPERRAEQAERTARRNRKAKSA